MYLTLDLSQAEKKISLCPMKLTNASLPCKRQASLKWIWMDSGFRIINKHRNKSTEIHKEQ